MQYKYDGGKKEGEVNLYLALTEYQVPSRLVLTSYLSYPIIVVPFLSKAYTGFGIKHMTFCPCFLGKEAETWGGKTQHPRCQGK